MNNEHKTLFSPYFNNKTTLVAMNYTCHIKPYYLIFGFFNEVIRLFGQTDHIVRY